MLVLQYIPYGIKGLIKQIPGHTSGSLIVELEDHWVFVGDMILGGYFGGNLFANSPGEHYFQADRELNNRNVRDLLKKNFKIFYLGHGGPVTKESILAVHDFDPVEK